jgi:16S rRNA (guanine(966)-N(2))-methyltransferase RsmD
MTGLAKKSLFGILAPYLVDAKVADLYCGTGTLGLEAISNGAAHCWFAERDKAVLDRLGRNIQTLGAADRCTVWRGDVLAGLARRLESAGERLDVVFVDPPYAHSRKWDWAVTARKLFAPLGEHLAADAIVVVRTESSVEVPSSLAELDLWRRKEYGGMAVDLFKLRTTEGGQET